MYLKITLEDIDYINRSITSNKTESVVKQRKKILTNESRLSSENLTVEFYDTFKVTTYSQSI